MVLPARQEAQHNKSDCRGQKEGTTNIQRSTSNIQHRASNPERFALWASCSSWWKGFGVNRGTGLRPRISRMTRMDERGQSVPLLSTFVWVAQGWERGSLGRSGCALRSAFGVVEVWLRCVSAAGHPSFAVTVLRRAGRPAVRWEFDVQQPTTNAQHRTSNIEH